MHVEVGESFGRERTFEAPEVAAFARSVGDTNPLHHDPDVAARTRFGGLIVSGPQLSAELSALVAHRFSRGTQMLGLEFTFRFRRAVRVGAAVRLSWTVVRAVEKPGLGLLVDCAGMIADAAGEVHVEATGRSLVTESL